MKRVLTVMLLAVIVVVFVFLGVSMVDDPLVNFTTIPGATVVAYQPSCFEEQVRVGMRVQVSTEGYITVRLPNGSLWKSDHMPIFEGNCKIGGKATANVRIGRLWPRVIKVAWVTCEVSE